MVYHYDLKWGRNNRKALFEDVSKPAPMASELVAGLFGEVSLAIRWCVSFVKLGICWFTDRWCVFILLNTFYLLPWCFHWFCRFWLTVFTACFSASKCLRYRWNAHTSFESLKIQMLLWKYWRIDENWRLSFTKIKKQNVWCMMLCMFPVQHCVVDRLLQIELR